MWKELPSSARHRAGGGAIVLQGQPESFLGLRGQTRAKLTCGFWRKFCGLEFIAQLSRGRLRTRVPQWAPSGEYRIPPAEALEASGSQSLRKHLPQGLNRHFPWEPTATLTLHRALILTGSVSFNSDPLCDWKYGCHCHKPTLQREILRIWEGLKYPLHSVRHSAGWLWEATPDFRHYQSAEQCSLLTLSPPGSYSLLQRSLISRLSKVKVAPFLHLFSLFSVT